MACRRERLRETVDESVVVAHALERRAHRGTVRAAREVDRPREDVHEVVNLQKLFNVAVYVPFGMPLVRALIRLPRNRVFEVTQLSFLWYQHAVVSGYGMLDDFLLGLKNLRNIFQPTSRKPTGKSLAERMETGVETTV